MSPSVSSEKIGTVRSSSWSSMRRMVALTAAELVPDQAHEPSTTSVASRPDTGRQDWNAPSSVRSMRPAPTARAAG